MGDSSGSVQTSTAPETAQWREILQEEWEQRFWKAAESMWWRISMYMVKAECTCQLPLTFSTRSLMTEWSPHMSTGCGGLLSTGQKLNKCSECGKEFTWKDTLAWHQRIHTGERPHECSKCGKCFSQSCDLFKHQTIHTGERPYKCNECRKFFRQVSDQFEHRRVHTGKRLFQFSNCGKFFDSKSNLIQHKEVHTGARPYMCSECGKEFNCKHTLVLHQRTHIRENPYECSKCGKTSVKAPTLIYTGEFTQWLQVQEMWESLQLHL